MTDPTEEPADPTSTVPRWTVVAGGLAGAILAGGLLGVLVTGAADLIARADPTSTPLATIAASRPPEVAPSPTPSHSPRISPSPSASPSPTPRASTPPPPSPSATQAIGMPEGCFRDGLQREPDDGDQGEMVVAEDLQGRLPLPHFVSEPRAVVGSSANTLFVSAFAACTGADPSTIRFGTVSGGLTMGVIPFAIQIDGYSGPELAEILIAGMLAPEQAAGLGTDEHGGWTYRYHDSGLAITASDDTVYWMQIFCCVDVMDPDADLPSFESIVHDYLDRTNDRPADA